MSIKNRLEKLEKKRPTNDTNFTMIICNDDESSGDARKRWQAANPGVSPGHTIFVQFVSPNKVQP